MSSGILKERQQQELEKELKIVNSLTSSKKRLEAIKQEKKRKRKTVDELLRLLRITDIQDYKINDPWTYVPRSYNLDRQIVGLLNHLFVRYSVPDFLYRTCMNFETRSNFVRGNGVEYKLTNNLATVHPKDKFNYMYDLYRSWFIVIAQGGSFSKKVKGMMTSKEAHYFLKAPSHYNVHENVWWAKMIAAGIPDCIIQKLIDKIFANHFFDDPDGRLAEVIQFFAHHYAEIHKEEFGAITDFIAWKLTNDRTFRFKGRTVTSMINLTNEWHMLIQKAKLGSNVFWDGSNAPYWQHVTNDAVWDVRELLNNKELMNEGRKQKHCVYSYVPRCISGQSYIYSLRKYRKTIDSVNSEGEPVYALEDEQTRITFEATSGHTIVQISGLQNRTILPEEKSILKIWAGANGFTMNSIY